MEGSQLPARVVVRTSKLKFSRRRYADYVKKNCARKRAARVACAARLFSLIQPIKSLICGVVVAGVISSKYPEV